jgi:hypothetical protein
MKDTKFTELLNLYLDHQISEHEAAQLEAEVRRSPERLRLYRQYCRMQKACTLLAENARVTAPEQAGTGRQPGRRRLANVYALASLAAAACVALVVVIRTDRAVDGPSTAPEVVVAGAADNITTAAVTASATTFMARNDVLRTVLTTQALAQVGDTAGRTLAFPHADPARFEWMTQVQMHPVAFEPADFPNPAETDPASQTFRSRRPFPATVEMTAFQFQK